MIHTISSAEALLRRRVVKSQGTGVEHWGTGFFGEMRCKQIKDEPQALLTDMDCNEITKSHFHAVDQFHVFVAGSGKMGRSDDAGPLRVQYLDHHTGYGPIYAGPQGLSYFALRNRTDSGPIYLDQPGYRDHLEPTKRRNRFTSPIALSSEPVLMKRETAAFEPLLEADGADGLAAFILRLGPGMVATAPDPKAGGGHYFLVVNGSLERAGASLPVWSMVFVESSEAPPEVHAGPKGLEMLIMQFPRRDA